jgi:hypothetical protein
MGDFYGDNADRRGCPGVKIRMRNKRKPHSTRPRGRKMGHQAVKSSREY